MAETHYLYVIGREAGPVKVGITKSLGARLATIQTGCPFKLDLLASFPMRSRAHALDHESHFHGVYEDVRLVGEWFKLDAGLAIEGVETGLQIEEYFESRGAE